MSLDTVLKIGNILRNSKDKMNFPNAVVSCREDNKGCWPFCLSLPVDKDFNVIFDKVSEVPENRRNSLYYLMYITSIMIEFVDIYMVIFIIQSKAH